MHRSRRKSRKEDPKYLPPRIVNSKSSTPFGNALVIACIKLMAGVPE
jgi:hypothetical protein